MIDLDMLERQCLCPFSGMARPDSSKPLSDWSATDLVQGHGGRGQAQDRRDGGVPIVHGFEGGLRPTNYVMMLAGSSSFKGKDDMATYDKAMEVVGFIASIRADFTEKLGRAYKHTKQELKQRLRTMKSGKGSVPLRSHDNAMKVAATKAGETAKALRKAAQQAKQEAMYLFAKNPSAESMEGRIKNWGDKIKKLQIDIRDRDDNKEVSLSTSKINYMESRVSVAWCKRHEVPVEKVFAKTLRDKFVWAMNVPPDWNFSYETLDNSKQGRVGRSSPPGRRQEEGRCRWCYRHRKDTPQDCCCRYRCEETGLCCSVFVCGCSIAEKARGEG